jgi:hypothetical protein
MLPAYPAAQLAAPAEGSTGTQQGQGAGDGWGGIVARIEFKDGA